MLNHNDTEAYLNLQSLKPELEKLISNGENYCEQLSNLPLGETQDLQQKILSIEKKLGEIEKRDVPHLLCFQVQWLNEARNNLEIISGHLGERYSKLKMMETTLQGIAEQWLSTIDKSAREQLAESFFEGCQEYAQIKLIRKEIIPRLMNDAQPHKFYLETSELCFLHAKTSVKHYESQYIQAATLPELEQLKENLTNDIKKYNALSELLMKKWVKRKSPKYYQIVKSPHNSGITELIKYLRDLSQNPDHLLMLQKISKESERVSKVIKEVSENFSLSDSYLNLISQSGPSFAFSLALFGAEGLEDKSRACFKPHLRRYKSLYSEMERCKLQAKSLFAEELDKLIGGYDQKKFDISVNTTQQISYLRKMINYASLMDLLPQEAKLVGIKSQLQAYSGGSITVAGKPLPSLSGVLSEPEPYSDDDNIFLDINKVVNKMEINEMQYVSDPVDQKIRKDNTLRLSKLDAEPLIYLVEDAPGERIISAAYFGANEASNPELRSYCQRITGVDGGKMDTRKLSDRVKNHPSVNDSWSQLDKKIYQALQDNSSLV